MKHRYLGILLLAFATHGVPTQGALPMDRTFIGSRSPRVIGHPRDGESARKKRRSSTHEQFHWDGPAFM